MGIRTTCPNGHKLNVKAFLAGLRGICPHCGASFTIPTESNRSTSKADAVGSSGPQVQAAERGTVGPSDGPSQPHPVSRQAASSGPVKRPPPLPAGSADAADQPAAGREAVAAATTTSQFAVRQSLGPVAGSPSAPAVVSTVRQPSAKAPTEAATPSRPAEASTSPLSGFVATASATVAEPEPPATLPPELQAPDPLTEAPDAVWYVRPASGGQFGPAGNEIMRTWLGEGRIGPDSLVWREGWRDWQEAATTFPQFGTDPGNVAGILAASAPVASHSAAGHHAPGRRRTDSAGILLICLLFLAVIVLVSVLCWFLLRQPGEPPVSAADISPRAVAVLDGPARSLNERAL